MSLHSQPPFVFETDGKHLVDDKNRLRATGYQGPEYAFSVSIEPTDGMQADAWPLRERAYFEFRYQVLEANGDKACVFSMAVVHQPFGRDFPDRTGELLDAIIPLIIPTDLWMFPEKMKDAQPIVSERMLSLLLQGKSYFRHRDEIDTDTEEYQKEQAANLRAWNRL